MKGFLEIHAKKYFFEGFPGTGVLISNSSSLIDNLHVPLFPNDCLDIAEICSKQLLPHMIISSFQISAYNESNCK